VLVDIGGGLGRLWKDEDSGMELHRWKSYIVIEVTVGSVMLFARVIVLTNCSHQSTLTLAVATAESYMRPENATTA